MKIVVASAVVLTVPAAVEFESVVDVDAPPEAVAASAAAVAAVVVEVAVVASAAVEIVAVAERLHIFPQWDRYGVASVAVVESIPGDAFANAVVTV